MTARPRFSLKAMLGITAALCFPLALITWNVVYGLVWLPLTLGGCVGYLLNGWEGVWQGVIAVIVATVGLMIVTAVLLAVMFLLLS